MYVFIILHVKLTEMTIQKLDKNYTQAKTFKIQHDCRFCGNEKCDDLENVLKLIVLSIGIMWPKMASMHSSSTAKYLTSKPLPPLKTLNSLFTLQDTFCDGHISFYPLDYALLSTHGNLPLSEVELMD